MIALNYYINLLRISADDVQLAREYHPQTAQTCLFLLLLLCIKIIKNAPCFNFGKHE